MITIYARWINDENKDFTIDDVPTRWKDAVKKYLQDAKNNV